MSAMPNKDETYLKILQTVLRLEFQKGHLKWSISEISRISGVTRSLIYYYFGQKKEEIMEEAALFFAKRIFRVDEDPKTDIPIWCMTGDRKIDIEMCGAFVIL